MISAGDGVGKITQAVLDQAIQAGRADINESPRGQVRIDEPKTDPNQDNYRIRRRGRHEGQGGRQGSVPILFPSSSRSGKNFGPLFGFSNYYQSSGSQFIGMEEYALSLEAFLAGIDNVGLVGGPNGQEFHRDVPSFAQDVSIENLLERISDETEVIVRLIRQAHTYKSDETRAFFVEGGFNMLSERVRETEAVAKSHSMGSDIISKIRVAATAGLKRAVAEAASIIKPEIMAMIKTRIERQFPQITGSLTDNSANSTGVSGAQHAPHEESVDSCKTLEPSGSVEGQMSAHSRRSFGGSSRRGGQGPFRRVISMHPMFRSADTFMGIRRTPLASLHTASLALW